MCYLKLATKNYILWRNEMRLKMATYYKCVVAYDIHHNDYDEIYIGAAEDDEAAYEIAHEIAHEQHALNGKEIYDITVLEVGCDEGAWDM